MIKIKKAKINQSQKIRALENEIWDEEVVNIYDMAAFITFGYVFIAEDKNKIIGAICAFATKNNEVYLNDWVVDKKHRGKGIGKKLFEKLKKEIGNKNIISYVELKNGISVAAHKKLGFELVKKVKDPYDLKKEEYRFFFRRKVESM